ncbi:DUF7673 family protein [Agrobacterium tumefaciens]|uniref:DUF7673 family protein n=1 Tax=Agrobacterium tumefaciens TaxID=358 RepID=UPI0022434F25|nr:hypothetical protein [Agrobacterium tumefaciens]MCW8060495.1 hypothetical protein [Agrobacterium tumefaciens]MCW8145939.1 hypothetical protein [Agrobacterium tumefaciens]
MDDNTRGAFERLLDLARSDTGQARRAANFILAWWNADSLGGFDIADLFAVDMRIAADMATVFTWLSRRNEATYPEEYRAAIEAVIAEWRPDNWVKAQEPA